MSIWANHIERLKQSCGITEVGFFRGYSAKTWDHSEDRARPLKTLKLENVGAGWALASFTDSTFNGDVYQQAYEELKKKYRIVYQSPVRRNRRTGFKFFFCIYDTTQKGS